MTDAVLEPGRDFSGEASARDVGTMAFSLLNWTLMAPFMALHEAAHVVAVKFIGGEFKGAGATVLPLGTYRGWPVFDITSFFVYGEHDGASDAQEGVITFAPFAWLVVALFFVDTPLAFAFFVLTGLTGLSDLYMEYGDVDGLRRPEGSRVFLVGSPGQVQRTLGWYG